LEGTTIGKTIFLNVHVFILKKKFSRTSEPISIKLGTNHPYVKGIQNCTNKGPGTLQKGDNHKNANMRWCRLKPFSRSSKPNSIKIGTRYPWMKGIQFYSNKGPGPLQKGNNHKNVKMGWGNLKIFFSRSTSPEEFIFTWKYSDIM
jgi:hypothetical protein